MAGAIPHISHKFSNIFALQQFPGVSAPDFTSISSDSGTPQLHIFYFFLAYSSPRFYICVFRYAK